MMFFLKLLTLEIVLVSLSLSLAISLYISLYLSTRAQQTDREDTADCSDRDRE